MRASEQDALLSTAASLVVARGEVFGSRDRASHALSRSLPNRDVDALLLFLLRKPGEDSAAVDELATLKNNVADALLSQADLPLGLLDSFESAFADKAQGEIWREYVVQKIPEWVRRAPESMRDRGVAFLRKRLADTDYIYAGTALLGMHRLHHALPTLADGEEVAAAARRILQQDAYAVASKITALQILARHQPDEARIWARRWIDGERAVMLRVSAIATLGEVGEAVDQERMARYTDSPELRLRTAARAALLKLSSH